jgi:hypothetical protein
LCGARSCPASDACGIAQRTNARKSAPEIGLDRFIAVEACTLESDGDGSARPVFYGTEQTSF